MISIVYSGSYREYELKRIHEEAKNYDNLELISSDDITFPPENLFKNTKVFYFIGSLRKMGISNLEVLANYLKKKNIRIVNRVIENYHIMNKTFFYYRMLENNIKIPKIKKINSEKNYKEILDLGFPVIAKFDYIHLGKGVFLIENMEELLEFLNKNKDKLAHIIFQEYIPYERDVRVIVIGDPIGGMERINPGFFKANIAQGGYGKPFKIDEEIEEISKNLSKIFDIEIFAFDLLIKGKTKYVIDLHIIFRFEGFEKYTKVNVARKILEYLNEVHSKS